MTLTQDEEHPENWYFFKDREHGFAIREDVKKKICLFSHAVLVRTLVEALGLDREKSAKAMIAGQPTVMKGDKAGTQYWGIIFRPSL